MNNSDLAASDYPQHGPNKKIARFTIKPFQYVK